MLNTLVKPIAPNMYRYDEFDAQFVGERVNQFAGQVARRLSGELTEDQLVSVLTETKNALTKQFAKLMAMEGVELEFSADALRELAVQALTKGTGARALRALIERLMLDVMYEIPSSGNVLAVTITRPAVLGESKPIIRRKQDQAAA